MTTYITDSSKLGTILQVLSLAEMGAYIRLGNHYILAGAIERDMQDIYRLCQASNKSLRNAVDRILEKFFQISDCGKFFISEHFHPQREESKKYIEAKSKAGHASAEARKRKSSLRQTQIGSTNSSNQLENNDSDSTLVEPLISLLEDKKEEGKPSSSHLPDAREEKMVWKDPPNELQSCNTVAKIQQVVTECFPNILSGGVVIEEWIRQGADPDLDIIPTIRDLALKKGPSLRSISYLTPCVAQAKQARETTKKTFGETHHAKTFERPQVANRRPSATELQRRLREQYGPNLDGNQPDRREPIDVTRSEALGEIGGFAT